MEQNREPWNRPTGKEPTNIWWKGKGNFIEKGESSQQMVLEKQDIHRQQSESAHWLYTFHKH